MTLTVHRLLLRAAPLPRFALLALCLAPLVAGCGRGNAQVTDTAMRTDAPAPILIAQEDLAVLHTTLRTSATVITGSVQPERRADLRAEMSALVLQVLRDNGEQVKKGELLVRLDDAALRAGQTAADESTRVAEQALAQAQRQYQRLQRLRGLGLASTQELEEAAIRRNDAHAELAATSARAAQAHQQLQHTEVRAPFDGITSERRVSPGDTVQIGKELIKVLDPASMQVEGFVSAERIGAVRVGQAVSLELNGERRQLAGTIRRIDPAANPVTRQVAVLVGFDNRLVAPLGGLSARGRIEGEQAAALSIKASAVVREGDQTYAWRVQGDVVHKVALVLGAPDPRSGYCAVSSGLADGDTVIRRPVSALRDGQKVVMTRAIAPPA